MIICSPGNTRSYEQIHPLFRRAFDYLRSTDFSTAEPGKIELQGTDLFAVISDSPLKNEVEAKLEVHNDYIDIQLPVSKTEQFGWKPREELVMPQDVFDKEKDIQFFDDPKSMVFDLPEGHFVIFFPEDGHAPCIGEGIIRKVVVKIKI